MNTIKSAEEILDHHYEVEKSNNCGIVMHDKETILTAMESYASQLLYSYLKVISLLQPWATLVVIGAKKIETRSWNTKYRGPILIHASKSMESAKEILDNPEIYNSFSIALQQADGKIKLPFGAIIGKVNIVDSIKFEKQDKKCLKLFFNHELKLGWEFTDQELAFGDYSAGRYGWLLNNPVQFKKPIPAKGSRMFWDYELKSVQV